MTDRPSENWEMGATAQRDKINMRIFQPLLGGPSNELFGKTWDFVPTEGEGGTSVPTFFTPKNGTFS